MLNNVFNVSSDRPLITRNHTKNRWILFLYMDESKVLHYFDSMIYNLAAQDDFAKVMKGTKYNGLWNIDLAWYSPSDAQRIYLSGLDHGFRNNAFRSTWPCLIVEVLVTWPKFLEPSGYCTVINCVFTLDPTYVFGCFRNIRVAQFELEMHRFPK